MESATLTRLVPGRTPRPSLVAELPWPRIALAGLVIAVAVLAAVYPTYPNYDSWYSLVWGRELLHGQHLSFEAYRAPTQHPLAILFGAVLALAGRDADHLLVLATLASFVALAAGLHRLGRASFTSLVGLVAAALLFTRFDFAFLAFRGYIDIPYLALVVWAAALEAGRPRRGAPVLVLLALAGLLRPECWLLSALYAVWLLPREAWPARVRHAGLVVAAPVLWCALDWAVTGDPLYSQHHTSGLAEELGRQRTLGEIPSASLAFLRGLTKPPVFYAGVTGLVLAGVLVPLRTRVPVALLVVGMATFVLIGLAGLSIIDRYLLVPSMVVMLFAGVTLAGWTMLEPGTLPRLAWSGLALVALVYGAVFTILHVDLAAIDSELTWRGASHRALVRLLDEPRVRDAIERCGVVSTPSHKLVPEVRWVLGARATEDRVVSRGDPAQRGRARRGVALFASERLTLLRQALSEGGDDPMTSVPGPGFTRLATTRYYAAYVRC